MDMNIEQEIKLAARRARDYYTALTGEQLPAMEMPAGAASPLRASLVALREASAGRAVEGLTETLGMLERLGLVPDGTGESLDVRDPRGPVEVAAARAVTWERLRKGRSVASVHLARLGGVGSSAIRMAAREGRLQYDASATTEGDPRTYVTAATAAEWLYQRQQALARVRTNEEG